MKSAPAPLSACVLLACLCAAPASGAERRIDFSRDVYPILQRSCVECHGPDKKRGGLRLDRRPAAFQGGELLRRVLLPKGSEGAMPARGEPLSQPQIDTLRAWIGQGADWPAFRQTRHWAYVAPRRPAPPAVRNAAWVRNPIDAFVLSRLEREGFSPSPEADRATLLRRLSLDMVGLPPTPDEVIAFENDSSPQAYEKQVDRLLASLHSGERWARPWLDLARYADSHGFQRDDLRPLWPYRDWVIRALNADLPFDQFTALQVAGDLLPAATTDQKVATGFHRCAPTNVEAGSDPEDTRVNQVHDRVNTTAAVWLGTTLECAQCHDHKYDPFAQRDYYRLFAFFNSTAIEADRAKPNVPGSIRFLGPYLSLPQGAKTLVMQELPRPRTTRIFLRGDFRTPGEEVRPGTPATLPALPEEPANRLALARWLVWRDNPLTARVTVNRWWAELFGRGIVSTVEDFGVKGDAPTHPELLDWLAVELMDGGWSMKKVLRTVVTSSTYRQSSRLTPLLQRRDDRNLLLARGPRFRLDAEMIRDNALAVAGLLSRRQFGPPIRPYQPPGLWAKIGGDKVDYVVSPGEERHRRGVYVVWKRSAPYPSFANFDATARLACVVKRSRTNTPLQALTLLNDPVYVEAAVALAGRIVAEKPGASVEERIRHAFRLCLARPPRDAEVQVLRTLYQAQLQAGAESAAWCAVATALLNLDEAITKG